MSDNWHNYRCLIEGTITLDSTTPCNTSGAFCDLFTATHPTVGKLALKKPRGNYDERLVAHIEIEAKVWASLKHPRILQFLGIHTIGKDVYLVSAFAENGCLTEFLERQPEVDRKRLVIEIAEGLAYLHQCGIIHGDLKGSNVLISSAEHVLLCDFGLAKHITSRTATSLRGAGSIPWQSPELLQDISRRSFQSDVYAFGITVYEVLSGKEPYANHTGMGSILLATLQGDRPPREPQVAPDGSSYLQFWDEASRCWAEDPSRRPRIFDVLKRLDRQRAETLATSVLEDSLALPIQATSAFQLSSSPDLSSSRFDGANKQDTLDWAHRIRVRMNLVINAQRPVYRISEEIIIMIIKAELNLSAWTDWHSESYNSWTSISGIKRCAALTTVCRAWRDAIEHAPELTRFILMEYQGKNVEHVRRCNHNGPIELFLCQPANSTWDEMSSFLGSLIHRVSSLNIYATTLIIRSIPLPMLRVVRIEGVYSPGTLAADLIAMIQANQGLIELTLNSISGVDLEPNTPRLRVDHSSLERVRLTGLSRPLASHILHCLGLRHSVFLKANGICLENLSSPDSAFGDLIRSRAREGSYALHLEVTPTGGDVAGEWYSGRVKFYYNMHDQASLPNGQSRNSEATGSWDCFESEVLTSEHALDMVRTLQDSGMKSVMIGGWPVAMLADLLQCLSPVMRLELRSRGTLDLLHQLGQPLQNNPESGDEHPQFLCPNLTTLDLGNALITSYHSSSVHSGISLMLQKRHAATHLVNGPARLQKIILPSKWHTENDFSGSLFEEIEIHSKE